MGEGTVMSIIKCIADWWQTLVVTFSQNSQITLVHNSCRQVKITQNQHQLFYEFVNTECLVKTVIKWLQKIPSLSKLKYWALKIMRLDTFLFIYMYILLAVS